MTAAGKVISNFISFTVIKFAASKNPENKFINGLTMNMNFIQPKPWIQDQRESKLIPAIFVCLLILFFPFMAVVSSCYFQIKQYRSGNERENLLPNENSERIILLYADRLENDSSGYFLSQDSSNQIENTNCSKDDEKITISASRPLVEEKSASPLPSNTPFYLNRDPVYEKFLNCFNPSINSLKFKTLRPFKREHPDLVYLDGIRAMMTLWYTFGSMQFFQPKMAMSNFISLIVNLKSIEGVFMSAGVMGANVIFFVLYIISFVKLSQFYDERGGIGIKSYFKILFNRFLTFAPIYYIVFLFGQFVYPLMSDRANWIVSGYFFQE